MIKFILLPRNTVCRSVCTFVLAVFFVSSLQFTAYGDSLWAKRVAANTNLFADNRARQLGDTVVVIISEKTDVLGVEDNDLSSQKEFSNRVDAADFFPGRPRSGGQSSAILQSLPNINGASDNSFEAEGEYTSTRNISFRLTAIVTEVLGNGNLIIEGKRGVEVNNERYTLRVSGIIRPIDIDQHNVVLSETMANANISLSGKGFLTRNAKRGWGYRVLDMIWPF